MTSLKPNVPWQIRGTAVPQCAVPSTSRVVCSHPLVPREGCVWSGKIRDVSAKGVGLVLDRSFPPGTALMVMLRNPAKSFFRTVTAMVVHSRLQEDARWLVGCALLSELKEDEVNALQ